MYTGSGDTSNIVQRWYKHCAASHARDIILYKSSNSVQIDKNSTYPTRLLDVFAFGGTSLDLRLVLSLAPGQPKPFLGPGKWCEISNDNEYSTRYGQGIPPEATGSIYCWDLTLRSPQGSLLVLQFTPRQVRQRINYIAPYLSSVSVYSPVR
jgi:hypothetical protein